MRLRTFCLCCDVCFLPLFATPASSIALAAHSAKRRNLSKWVFFSALMVRSHIRNPMLFGQQSATSQSPTGFLKPIHLTFRHRTSEVSETSPAGYPPLDK